SRRRLRGLTPLRLLEGSLAAGATANGGAASNRSLASHPADRLGSPRLVASAFSPARVPATRPGFGPGKARNANGIPQEHEGRHGAGGRGPGGGQAGPGPG